MAVIRTTASSFCIGPPSLLDPRRPCRDIRRCHGATGGMPCVAIAPALDIHEVLLPGEQRALADRLGRRRGVHLAVQAAQQVLEYPRGNTGSLGRVDEVEEHKVAQQDPPVWAEATDQPRPIEALAPRMDDVGDVRAVIAFT